MFWRRNRHTAGHGQDAQPAGIPQEMLDRVRAIEIRARRLVNDLFLGEYQAVFRGRGLEFDELRQYVPGDDVRSIDWKAYARSGQPMIRRYREDRDLTVMFVVDVSASQRAGALPRTKEDLAAELCAVLALAAIRNKDRVGLLLFASKPERYVRPQGGATHVLRVVREVLWARPEARAKDIGGARDDPSGLRLRRATVSLVSEFLAPDYSSQRRAAALHHDIIAIRVREPLDGELPDAGIVPVRDAETGSLVEVDSSSARVRDAYRERVAAIDSDRRRLFGELGIDEIRVTVGTDWVPELLRFFKRRAVGAA